MPLSLRMFSVIRRFFTFVIHRQRKGSDDPAKHSFWIVSIAIYYEEIDTQQPQPPHCFARLIGYNAGHGSFAELLPVLRNPYALRWHRRSFWNFCLRELSL